MALLDSILTIFLSLLVNIKRSAYDPLTSDITIHTHTLKLDIKPKLI